MTYNKITIESTIAAPLSVVWDRWTHPDHITKWNFASPDWHCPSAFNELKVGGKYSARMEARDRSFGFEFEAFYDEVVPQQLLSYTMSDGRRATTSFRPVGEKTVVTTTFDAEKENSEQMQSDGWQAILNNFKTYVELSRS